MKRKTIKKLSLKKSNIAILSQEHSLKGGNRIETFTCNGQTREISVCICNTFQVNCETAICPVPTFTECIC
ncbi:hypothetical protein [Ascidiimonas aurantiaca]|uniref:hypothetical protein n=1 Tax=Ascidiimonas aurantiaca TaxID=1685432 RepID=UPI0030EEDACC